jgi:predicted  nucleic acid-binding Zn-ribbon protein
MQNEINIMIELQHFWDNIMKFESEIVRCNKSIKIWENRLNEISAKVSETEIKLKNYRLSLKKNELDLEEIETRIHKSGQRKDQLKSEREIEAQNNELIRLDDSKGKLESVILELLENVEKTEKLLADFKNEFSETDKQVKNDIEELNKKILSYQKESESYRNKFSELLEILSPTNRAKFSKLVNSKDGVAIAKLNGEICSRCNFKVPSSIAVSASSHKKIEVCTNCGRFIY